MSATAQATLGSLRIAGNAVSASYECVLDAEHVKQIAGEEVAQVVRQARISPIKLVSRDESAAAPQGRYISLDLEDFQ